MQKTFLAWLLAFGVTLLVVFAINFLFPKPYGFLIGLFVQQIFFIGFSLLLCKQAIQKKFFSVGLKRFCIGLLICLGLLILWSSLIALFPTETKTQKLLSNSVWFKIGFVILSVGLAPIAEELFFRGALFQLLKKSFSTHQNSKSSLMIGIFVSSLTFAALHGYHNLAVLLQLFGLAIVLCFAVEKWGLHLAISIHVINNALVAFSISGQTTAIVVFITALVMLLISKKFSLPPSIEESLN